MSTDKNYVIVANCLKPDYTYGFNLGHITINDIDGWLRDFIPKELTCRCGFTALYSGKDLQRIPLFDSTDEKHNSQSS